MSLRLPFTILWVDGNHEGFSLLNKYPVDIWNGGKVHHIAKNKIIHLMRGQVFTIEGKTFFTFGGAASYDISGGILDKNSPTYWEDYKKASKSGKSFRILEESWWKAELPDKKELKTGRKNLEKINYQVDYVISHCAANQIQHKLEKYQLRIGSYSEMYPQNILTNYFEELENELQYKQWFCGHIEREYNKVEI